MHPAMPGRRTRCSAEHAGGPGQVRGAGGGMRTISVDPRPIQRAVALVERGKNGASNEVRGRVVARRWGGAREGVRRQHGDRMRITSTGGEGEGRRSRWIRGGFSPRLRRWNEEEQAHPTTCVSARTEKFRSRRKTNERAAILADDRKRTFFERKKSGPVHDHRQGP